MSTKPQYRASLTETSLPEMLFSIARFRVPGTIEARSGDVVKRVYIRDGYVIHASSNDVRDRLGDFLRRSERLSEADFERATVARAKSERRFGVLLIEQGLLSPKEVFAAIRAHIEEIVWSLFNWQEGDVTFAIGEAKGEDMVQIQLPMRQVIMEGIQRAPDAKLLVARLGKKDAVYEPCFRWEDLIESGLGSEELELLMLVDAQKSLYTLCSLGPLSAADNAKLLYAFLVLHLVRRREVKQGSGGPLKVKLGT